MLSARTKVFLKRCPFGEGLECDQAGCRLRGFLARWGRTRSRRPSTSRSKPRTRWWVPSSRGRSSSSRDSLSHRRAHSSSSRATLWRCPLSCRLATFERKLSRRMAVAYPSAWTVRSIARRRSSGGQLAHQPWSPPSSKCPTWLDHFSSVMFFLMPLPPRAATPSTGSSSTGRPACPERPGCVAAGEGSREPRTRPRPAGGGRPWGR